jgi:hypothetical protein
MGVDAGAVGTALAKGRFLRMSGSETLNAIAARAAEWAKGQGLLPMFDTATAVDGALEVYLIPVAEPMRFRIDGKRVLVTFRSSSGGPGYHVAAIDLLDDLTTHLSIPWVWYAPDGNAWDDTGYSTSRDFATLEKTMTEHVAQIARIATQLSANGPIQLAINVPAGLGFPDGDAAGPLGPLTMTDIQAVTDRFYPWWDAGMTPATMARILRALLWQQATWRMPVNDDDRRVFRGIKRLRDHMVLRGIALPDDLAAAWAEYEACQTSELPPATKGIGYLRHPVNRQIYPSWTISMPGYAAPVVNGDQANFEHAGFWMGTHALIASLPDASQDIKWLPVFDGPETEPRPGLRCRTTDIRPADDKGGRVQQAMLVALHGKEQHCLILTLSSHLDWPFSQFASWVASVVWVDQGSSKG